VQLTKRAKLLLLAAAGVAVVVVLGPRPGNDVVAPVDHRAGEHHAAAGSSLRAGAAGAGAAAARGSSDSGFAMQRLAHRVVEAANDVTLFSPHSWYVAPPPPPPPPPPAVPVVTAAPVPTAPPLPFAFLGRYLGDRGTAVYYVTRGDRVYDLKVGDSLDSAYRFDGERDNQLVFTYQPLSVQQMLPMDAK
jgi:hypothetical protein